MNKVASLEIVRLVFDAGFILEDELEDAVEVGRLLIKSTDISAGVYRVCSEIMIDYIPFK